MARPPEPPVLQHPLVQCRQPRRFPVGPVTVDEALAAHPAERLALIDGEQAWTFGDLDLTSRRLASHLVASGVSVGDRIAWTLASAGDLLVALLATIRAGGIWIGIDPRATEHERVAVLADATPQAFHTELPRFSLDTGLGPLPDPDPHRPAAIGYTSGTTGQPKGVVHIHQQLLYPGAASLAESRAESDERIGTPLAFSTLNIMALVPLTALVRGATAVVLPGGTELAASIRKSNVTQAVLVPTHLYDLISGTAPQHLGDLSKILVGGARLDPNLETGFAGTGVTITSSYGLTEAPTGVARRQSHETGGALLPGIIARADTEGELLLAPDPEGAWGGCWCPTIGYWNNPDATAALYRDGWLRTGDFGRVDGQGRVFVDGRISSMINRGGSTISATEVEAVLRTHPQVNDVAVFGFDDERLGQRVAAAVVGNDLEVAALRDHVRQQLSGHKTPERWLLLPELPRNRMGKVSLVTLREQLAAAGEDQSSLPEL